MPQRSVHTYSQIQRDLNTTIRGRRSNLISGDTGDTNIERDLINRGVRLAISDIDFRGNIREAVLAPILMDNQYDYALPIDVKADKIIDFRPQNTDSRGEFEEYILTTPQQFDRYKNVKKNLFTILNDDLTRTLRVTADVEDETVQISTMEDTNWRSFDSDAVNDSDVKVDNDDFLEGNGSIRFQTDTTDSTDTAVGIQNTALNPFDLSPFLARGSAFVSAKLTTYDTGIHQITLRLGSDSSNYYQISDSTQNDCSAFQTGWNLARFDLQNRTTVGTPADSAIDYAAVFWGRDTTTTALLHLNDTDWGFDNLVVKRGKYYLLSYYSRYVWQDTALSLSENSTHDSHALLVQNDEYEVILAKIAELASQYLDDDEQKKYYASEYIRIKDNYLMNNPIQAEAHQTSRYEFGSLQSEPHSLSNDS